MLISVPCCILFLITLATAGAATSAFPGAEGAGKWSQGGRGGVVIEVTNLNDSGPGSLRAALAAKGPGTVVFRVSGTIVSRSPRHNEVRVTRLNPRDPRNSNLILCPKNIPRV